MSLPAVRIALETRLKAMTPDILTAYENASFEPPSDETPWQEVNLLPNVPDNSAIGGAYVREQGVFQISLMYPLLQGAGDVEARAAAIKAHFPRGLALVQSGVTITVETTPAIAPGFRDRDRWRVPVSVRYRAEVFT